MRSRANGPACTPRSSRDVPTMVNGPISTPSASSESRTIEHAPIRQSAPITVLPRTCANGSITVSIPMRTSASMTTVSGCSMVTPPSMSSRRLRSRSDGVHLRQLHAIVDSQRFARIVDLHRFHVMARPVEDFHHVGEVVLARRVVRPDLVHVLPEQVRAVTVDPHVGFADGQLVRRGGLLLDDSRTAGPGGTRPANHAAVAGGVVHHGAQQDACRLAGALRGRPFHQPLQRFRAQQRAIAVDDHQVAVEPGAALPAPPSGHGRCPSAPSAR